MTDTVAVNVVVALKKRICLNIDQVVILQGEMRCLSLLGLLWTQGSLTLLKGLNFPGFIRENKTKETGNTPILVEELKLTVVKLLKNQF